MSDVFFNMGIHGGTEKVFYVWTIFLIVFLICWPFKFLAMGHEFPWLRSWNPNSMLFYTLFVASWVVAVWLAILLELVLFR